MNRTRVFIAVTLALLGAIASATIVPAQESSQPANAATGGIGAALRSTIEGKGTATTTQSSPAQAASRDGEKRTPVEPAGRPAVLSAYEEFVATSSTAPLTAPLRQFGYDLFEKPPSSFAPVQNIPVGPEYVIGPGDEVRVVVWGRVEGSWSVVVDSNGNVSLPKVGVLGVTGLTFRELKELLRAEFGKYYTGYEMNVSLGALRTIRVYIIGNAQRPGAYTVSSFSTVINGLFEAGGPSKIGTLRDIQVKRNGKTIVHLDLYDFLLQGDKTGDIRLMPEDVIFIPSVGPLAAMAGNVRNPAIYELRGETRLLDLIAMSGGLTSIAFTGRVQVQRIEDHSTRTLFEGDLRDIGTRPEKNFLLQDGDVARIFTVADASRSVVVAGAVASPGTYGVVAGTTTIRDVLNLAGGMVYYASKQAELTRVTVTPAGPQTEIRTIDLDRALDGDPSHNLFLARNDYLFVRTVPEWQLYRTVTISGEVKHPGIYTMKKGELLSSLINRAGGFTEHAYLRGVMFTRERVREQQQRQLTEIAERLENELLGSGTAQISTASSSDEAKILQMELDQKRRFVEQFKTARAKGRVTLKLTDAAAIAGSSYDIELEQGDTVVVPSDPKTVQVIGSVYSQSAFVYQPGQSYGQYIEQAGGYTRNADDGRVYILEADGSTARANSGLFGSGGRVLSGDTIVVPEKIERIAWMRNIKDITQILYQIAVAAGVLIVVF